MNIKKLFSVAAVVTFVGSTFLNGLALAATPDTELGKAYEWAHSKGITTMDTYEAANMDKPITRAQMAKMLSVYAMSELGMKPDTTKTECNEFNDIANITGDLHEYIITSCQLGLMGQQIFSGIKEFRPNANISRAEFGTALSRTLWGGKYEGGTPYYANHLQALQSAGIMKIIANAETTQEIRGYVMLMLMRSAEGSETKADCEDPMIKAACLIDDDSCPAECKESSDNTGTDEKVKSGDLAVKATANNGGVILATGVSDMDTLTFKTSEEVEITKVVLERYGYSKNASIAKIWLEDENGTVISNEGTSLNSKAQVTLTLKKDYRKVDGTLNATIVMQGAEEDNALTAGNTVGFKVVDVTSTAKNVDLGDYSPYTYSVVDYDGADVTLTIRSAEKTYNWEAGKSYEVAKFKLKAPSDSAIEVKSFTLTDNYKNAIEYDDYLEDVTVTVAGKEVKSSWSVNKDDELVISLKDVELAAKDNSEFVVSMELADGFDNMGKSVNFYIASSADVSATDAKTNSRVLIKAQGGTDYVAAPGNWYKVKFEGGKVKINSTKLGNIEASEDSTDIVIAEGEITTSQTIKADRGVVKVTVTNNGGQIVNAMRLEIAGDEYEGYYAANADKYNANTKEQTFSFPAIDVDHSGKIRLLIDTAETAEQGDYATFAINGIKATTTAVPHNGFYYEDSKSKADVAGSLNISRLTLTASKASLTNSISSDEVEFKANENSEEETILKGTYTAKKRDVYLNEFFVGGANDNSWVENKDKMTVYLYIDGEAVADAELAKKSKTIDNTTYLWSAGDTFSNVKVEAGKTVSVELKAQVEAGVYADTDPSGTKFTLYVWGEDENGNNPSGRADKQTAKISIVKKGTAEVETSKAKKTILLRGATDAIAEFTVKPSGANNMDLESVSFLKPNIDCTKLKLEGAVDEDFVLSTDEKRCVADGFVETIGKDGETLRIVFDDEPTQEASLIEVEVKGLEINGKSISNTFAKGYADAVITFNQSKKDDITEFTIADIQKYNSSTKVYDLHFYNEAGQELATNGLVASDEISKGDTFTIKNLTSSVYVKKIAYTVKRGSFTQNVIVNYSDYADYFKTNDGDLRVYAYGDSKETGNKTTGTSVVIAAETADRYNMAMSDLQDINVVSGKITGTIKYVETPDPSAGMDGKHYFIALKVVSLPEGKTAADVKIGSAQLTAEEDWAVLYFDDDVDLNGKSIKVTVGEVVDNYDVSGLTLEPAPIQE